MLSLNGLIIRLCNMKEKNKFYFKWVLINTLAIGVAPRSNNQIDFLEQNGIKNILNLTSEKEYKPPFELLSRFNYKNISMPDHKSKKVPDISLIKDAVNYLEDANKKGPSFVHCLAAVERSPLVCIAYLMRVKKVSLNQSLNYLMQRNRRTNPLVSQYNILKEFT